MSVDVSGVKYIRRTIDTIYPVQLVSNTSLPTVMVRKNKTNADIMEINCMLQIVLSSKPADFRNTSFFIMQRARDEFCDILKKVIGWFRDESKNDLFFENEEGKLTINTSYKDLVATYSSFSVGVDVKGIQFVISLDQIDPITDNQAAGRARPIEGRKAFYFLCSDYGFERCIKSRKKRISYLKTTKASGFYNVWIGDK